MKHGKPHGAVEKTNQRPVTDRPGAMGWPERLVLLTKLGNSSGGGEFAQTDVNSHKVFGIPVTVAPGKGNLPGLVAFTGSPHQS